MKISLYPHQRKAIDELRSGSILCGGVGSGKSRAALAFYFCKICGGDLETDEDFIHLRNPKDLYIVTTARKRDTCDWQKEMLPFHLSTEDDLNEAPVHIQVDSWNNIKKYIDVSDAFFIFDEQRVVGKGAWVRSFYKIAKKNQWILLSATPGDTWMDYVPVFVANGFVKNLTEFKRRFVVYEPYLKYPKIHHYQHVKYLEKMRKAIIVEMPFFKGTVRHYEDIFVQYDPKTIDLIRRLRWNPYSEEPVKTAAEVCYAMRRCVNSDPTRLDAVRKLFSEHDKVIIFYNFDYELDELRQLCFNSMVEWREWNGHRHETIPKIDRWAYLVQYTAGCEGWNCTQTDTVIFYSLNYSYKVMEQASGRIDRINTKFHDLYYYRMRSNAPIDRAIFDCLRKKKRFNEELFVQTECSQEKHGL